MMSIAEKMRDFFILVVRFPMIMAKFSLVKW